MINKKPLLIHIGYPKGASTFLQKCLFRNEEEQSPFMTLPGNQAIQEFVLANEFSFSSEIARQAFQSSLSSDLVSVISNEILTGDQIASRYWGRTVADRIYETFPDAKILIIIREQKSMILSSYREYIKLGGTETIQRFIGTGKEKAGFGSICHLDFLKYHLLISYYHNLFGSANVLVLPYELLKKDNILFIEKILHFVGLSEKLQFDNQRINVGYRAFALAFRRKLNFFVQPGYFGDKRPPITWTIAQKMTTIVDKFTPSNIHNNIEQSWQNFIQTRTRYKFLESNQQTSKLTGLDLKAFSYDC
jgi:hypothetical protein